MRIAKSVLLNELRPAAGCLSEDVISFGAGGAKSITSSEHQLGGT
jgi:hypothetical protein